tara:strand:+ start:8895 stop:10190 length:1296 start_codon:yes stop_codon:yes gene_type:complete
MTWRTANIASMLVTLESGSRPKGGATVDSGEVPSLGGENILSDGRVMLERVNRVPVAFYSRMSKGHLSDLDVLINKDGAQTGKIGLYITRDHGPACINEHLFLLRGDPDQVTQGYLYYTLLSEVVQRQIRAEITGSAQPGLKSGFVNNVSALIPGDTREQDMIAEVLATVDRAIDETAAVIAKQQRIKTGLMQDLLTCGIDEDGTLRTERTHDFTDSPIGRVPVEWEVAPLSSFVPTAEYGISTSLGETGHPVLRMNNLSESEAELSDLRFTDAPVPEHLWLRPGDVLFNRTNSWQHVGRTGIWRGQIENATFASYLVRLNPHPEKLLSELLNLWLNWERTQIAMRRYATPAVQQVNINPTNLRMVLAAFPTCLKEQQAIVDRFAATRVVLETYQVELKKLHALRRGLMADLLSGDRRVTALLGEREAVTA